MSNQMKKLLAALLLIAGGVVFLVMGGISMKEINHYPQVSAVVSHIQRDWVPDSDGYDHEEIKIFVTYTVDGKEYTEELQNTKTDLNKGDSITVYYNPENPKEVSGATKGGMALQFAVGGVLLLAGLGTAAVTVIKGR